MSKKKKGLGLGLGNIDKKPEQKTTTKKKAKKGFSIFGGKKSEPKMSKKPVRGLSVSGKKIASHNSSQKEREEVLERRKEEEQKLTETERKNQAKLKTSNTGLLGKLSGNTGQMTAPIGMEDGKTTYRTTILDRMFSKASFESLEVDANFSVHDDTIFSKAGYSRIYNILNYPTNIVYGEEEGFLSIVFDQMKNAPEMGKGIDYYFESFNKSYHIRFDKRMIDRRKGLDKMVARINEGLNNHEGGLIQSSRDREIAKQSPDVLRYRLNEAQKKIRSHEVIKRNQNLSHTQLESFQFIRLVANSKKNLEIGERELTDRMRSLNVQIRKVKDVTDYLETFSPVSGLNNIANNNTFVPTVWTTLGYPKIRHTPTRILENEQAHLSRLLYVGSNIHNDEPLALTLTSSGEGQNIIIVGTTGSGKTYLYENLAINARLNHFRLNIMDYKGREYDNLASIIPGSTTLDFSSESSNFVNTLKFYPELYEDTSEAHQSGFATNLNSTATALTILSGIGRRDQNVAENVILYLLERVTGKYGVDYSDPNTYHRTQEISFRFDIYEALAHLRKDFVIDLFGEEICREIYVGLFPYFEAANPKSIMFEREIDLVDVIHSDSIIYSFYMNENSVWDTIVDYKIFIQDFISNLFIKRNKREGYTTLNSIEEYQRAIRSDYSKQIYNNKFSGGRSDNVVSVIMSNTLAPLLAQDLEIAAIRENIATMFIGKVEDKRVLAEFCNTYGLRDRDFRKINELDRLKHTFFCSYDTGVQKGGQAISVVHPEEVQRLFETKRIDRQEDFVTV